MRKVEHKITGNIVFKRTDTKTKQYKAHKIIPLMLADAAVKLIRDYFNETVKDPYDRYMSWQHCYKAFSENKNVALEAEG